MYDFFNPHKALVTRTGEVTYNEDSDPIQGPSTTFDVKGDAQPLYKGNALASLKQRLSEAGVDSEDAKRFYTNSVLRSADQFDKHTADTLIFNHIPNRKYYVFMEGDWNSGLEVDHNLYILVRMDYDAQR